MLSDVKYKREVYRKTFCRINCTFVNQKHSLEKLTKFELEAKILVIHIGQWIHIEGDVDNDALKRFNP